MGRPMAWQKEDRNKAFLGTTPAYLEDYIPLINAPVGVFRL